MKVWESIKCWSDAAPERRSIAPMSYRGLRNAVASCCKSLPDVEGKRVALFMGNRPLWGIYDIALTLKGAVVVPIPTFFSAGQVGHILKDAGIDVALVESMAFVKGKGLEDVFSGLKIVEGDHVLEGADGVEGEFKDYGRGLDPDRIAKIIYTSGTTGNPKGVMVRLSAMEAVTKSLVERSGANMSDRHLSLLPLSTLVETIGGLYAPLTAGGSIWYPASSAPEDILFNPEGVARCLADVAPTTLNLVPSLLGVITGGAGRGAAIPASLRFVAVGGAPLDPEMRRRAEELGIPLYEGYGLSECSSVVALSGPAAKREGSVGRILDHAKVEISEEGEIMVSGRGVMAGYTKDGMDEGAHIERIATGDLGYIDEDGYLFITGRKDNLILTNQGRNVSPEWVESVLLESPAVGQAFVYGNVEGEVSAFIVPSQKWLDKEGAGLALAEAIESEVAGASKGLPSYASVRNIRVAPEPFTIMNGLLGGDGRMMRKNILSLLEREEPSRQVRVEYSEELKEASI